jgi:peptidylprolyl isomerase
MAAILVEVAVSWAAMLPPCTILLLSLLASSDAPASAPQTSAPRTMAEILAASTPGDWRPLDPENTLYLDLAAGRVVIELAPTFAPAHVANVKALVREGFFDNLSINRAQDNYVVQWGDPDGEDTQKRRPMKQGKRTLTAEFDRPAAGLAFTALPDGDVYAPETGWSNGFPAGRDPKSGRAWLTHCYAMVGAGRDNDADSGSGADLYVVIGHAPRHLDRNVTLVGRVVQGIELLSVMPRGPAPMGFYEKAEQRVPIRAMRVAADLPAGERVALEALRTDTPTYAALVESRRNRREEWYKNRAGRIEVCNAPLPVRLREVK